MSEFLIDKHDLDQRITKSNQSILKLWQQSTEFDVDFVYRSIMEQLWSNEVFAIFTANKGPEYLNAESVYMVSQPLIKWNENCMQITQSAMIFKQMQIMTWNSIIPENFQI